MAAQAPPLLGPGGPGGPAQQPPQPLVSLPALPPQQQPGPADPGLELHLQGETERADHNAEQVGVDPSSKSRVRPPAAV